MGPNAFFLYSTLILVVIYEGKSVWCLQINDILVANEASHEASLDCRYSLESNETLHDVKWYKDGFEFFRCKSDGRMIQFSVEGITLLHSSELAKVGSCPLTMIGLHKKSAGEYACEVSIEFTFNAETKRSLLNYVDSSLIPNTRFESIKGAQFVKGSGLILQPCLSAILILIMIYVNKMIKN